MSPDLFSNVHDLIVADEEAEKSKRKREKKHKKHKKSKKSKKHKKRSRVSQRQIYLIKADVTSCQPAYC